MRNKLMFPLSGPSSKWSNPKVMKPKKIWSDCRLPPAGSRPHFQSQPQANPTFVAGWRGGCRPGQRAWGLQYNAVGFGDVLTIALGWLREVSNTGSRSHKSVTPKCTRAFCHGDQW